MIAIWQGFCLSACSSRTCDLLLVAKVKDFDKWRNGERLCSLTCNLLCMCVRGGDKEGWVRHMSYILEA